MDALTYTIGSAAYLGGLLLLIRRDPQGFRAQAAAELAAERPAAQA